MGLGNSRLKPSGKPEIIKLVNGRFRVIRRFHVDTDEDLYEDEIDQELFEPFGAHDGDEFGAGAEPARVEEVFEDAILIEQTCEYTPGSRIPQLKKTYETITDEFVAERDDLRATTENGIETVSRQLIAKAGTEHGLVVGVDTYDGKTLSSLQIEEHDAYVRVVAIYGGSGEIRTTTTTRFNGALSQIAIESLNEVPATPSGYTLISTDVLNENGYDTNRYTFVRGTNGIIRQTDETRNEGALLIREIEYMSPAGTASNPIPAQSGYTLISISNSEQDGYVTWTARYAQGENQVISIDNEIRNNGALLLQTITYLAESGTTSNPIATPANYVLVSDAFDDRDGHVVWRATYARGVDSQISVQDDTRNGGTGANGLKIRTIEYITDAAQASTPIATPAGYIKISETQREENGFKVWRATFADGDGEISREENDILDGAITYTTVTSLGVKVAATGEFETSTREEDGHRLFVSRGLVVNTANLETQVETRNNGALIIRTYRTINADPSGLTGNTISNEKSEQDGFTLHTIVTAVGTGEISREENDILDGAITYTTVTSLGAKVAATNEFEVSTREENGYDLFVSRGLVVNTAGNLQTQTETRNNGALIIRTYRRINQAPSGTTGNVIESNAIEQDGFTLFTTVTAQGTGQISSEENDILDGAITYTTITSLGSKVAATGEFEVSQREENGYDLFVSRGLVVNTVNLETQVETRENGRLITRTYRAINTDPSPLTGTTVSSQRSEQDGFTLHTIVTVQAVGGTDSTRRSSRPGPSSLPTSKINRTESYFDAVVPTGNLIFDEEIEEDGRVKYIKEAIEVTTGTKSTWTDSIDVDVPGIVNLSTYAVTEGTIATINVTPPRRDSVTATVTLSVQTTVPALGTLAYDIGGISCAVTSILETVKYIGTAVDVAGGFTLIQNNYRTETSVRHNTFPSCYITGTNPSEGTQSIDIGKDDFDNVLTETIRTEVVGTGSDLSGGGALSSLGYVTTGTIKQDVQPVLTALDGTIYYQVVKWTI